MSQVYSELGRLTEHELVIATGEGRGTTYTISDAGRSALAAWMRETAPGFPVLKHPVALRLLLGHVVDRDATLAMLRDHVRALAKERADLLEVRESLRGRDGPGAAFRHPSLVADWGLDYFDNESRIVSDLIRRLEEEGPQAQEESTVTRAVWLVVIGIISVQAGAAIAKDLFGTVSPTSLVFLRLATSTLVLLAISRPSWRGRSRTDWWIVAGFGASLGLMNWAIYQSFARIPLGIAVTIEFIGPLTLAVVGSRRARDLLWVGLAALGVVLLGFEPADLDAAGVAFALLAGAAWAAYILLSAQTGQRWPGFDGLAIASAFATLLLTGPALVSGGTAMLDPHVLLIGVLVGVLSSVIPYLRAGRTAVPAAERLRHPDEPRAGGGCTGGDRGARRAAPPIQWLAVVCVVVASVGATRSRPVLREPAPD